MTGDEAKKSVGVRKLTPTYVLFATLALLMLSACVQADTKHVRHLRTIKAQHDINWIAWHPDGVQLAGGGTFNNAITIWNTRTGEVVRELSDPGGGVQSLAFSPDGRYLAVGRAFTRLIKSHVHLSIFDVKSGEVIQRFSPDTPPSGTSNDVHAVVFSPDGRYVVASAYKGNRTGVVYDVESGKVVTTLPVGEGRNWVDSLAYNPDGQLLLVGGSISPTIPDGTSRGKIDVVATRDWSLVRTIKAHDTTVYSLAFCGGARYFVSASSAVSAHYEKGTNKKLDRYIDPIKIWDATTLTPIAKFQSDLSPSVQSVGCMPDGKILFASGRGFDIEIWDTQSGQRIEWLKGFGINAYVKPSPDGKHFAVAAKQKVEIWELVR